MAEELTLATPVVKPEQTTTGYKVARLYLDPEQRRFFLAVRGTQGEIVEATREGAVAMSLMNLLRTANGQVKSLDRRALEWLQTQPEGVAASMNLGTITGTPD
jgi:hypothetical protein